MTSILLLMLVCVVGSVIIGCTGSFIVFILVAIVTFQVLLGLFPGKLLPSSGKAVLITGCDTGIGYFLARHLHAIGFQVYAGCLYKNGEGATNLVEEFDERIVVVQMDVTKEEEVTKAFGIIKEHLKTTGKELWGVVNNAGINILGEIEWLDTELIKRVSEVNLWGMVRVTKAAIPLLQESKGRIVNIGSICGLASFPFTAPYCISKYGVESFTDALRLELSKWNIKTMLIQPGNFGPATRLINKDNIKSVITSAQSNMSEEVEQRYGQAYFDCVSQHLCSFTNSSSGSTDLTPVISQITTALLIERPQHRYMPASVHMKIFIYLHSFLPSTITDLLYSQILNYFNKKLKCKKL